jgi:alpha-1,3-glucan synthase
MMKITLGMYVTGSSSGSLFTALNFGDEGIHSSRGLSIMLIYMIGGTPVRSWVYRAALIQGAQQMPIAALFY